MNHKLDLALDKIGECNFQICKALGYLMRTNYSIDEIEGILRLARDHCLKSKIIVDSFKKDLYAGVNKMIDRSYTEEDTLRKNF